MSVVQLIPDFILVPCYAYLLGRIITSRDAYFHSTFFKFFISAGMCSLCSTIPFAIFTLTTYPVSRLWLYLILWMVNVVGSLGSTASKFFMCAHRYFVLRDVAMNENIWSRNMVHSLIASTYIVPFLVNIPVICMGYVTRFHDGAEVILAVSNSGTFLAKIYTTITYIVYVVGTILLTFLTRRHLSKLSDLVQGNTKREIRRTQRVMFIVVVCCTISHSLKCAHQVTLSYFVFTNTLTPEIYDTIIFPLYILTNALANYTAPVTLVIVSQKVRHLLLCGRRKSTEEYSRSNHATTSVLTTATTSLAVQRY